MKPVDAALIGNRVAAWAGDRGWPSSGWVREYGRVRPDGEPRAVLGFAHAEGLAVRAEIQRSGTVRISSAEDDAALPGLAPVLATLRNPRILRYRPGHRCTVRGDTDRGPRIVKVAPDGARHVAGARLLWAARRQLPFAVAEPCDWDPDTQSAWYAVVPGAPIDAKLLGPDAAPLAARLGTALAGLARAEIAPGGREGPAEQLARSGRAVTRAAAALPALGSELAELWTGFQEQHARLAPRLLVPVHGAPHQHQWLADGDRLGLIDFDRFALGDPELDLATLLVELADESDRRLPMPVLIEAAVAGYAAGDVSLDRRRLGLYLAHKRMAKACRTAHALRADAECRTRRHLATARTALRGVDQERSGRRLATH
ncbi:MAG: aminoglycoside phosphotransferase family protein [Geodermatophilaceae bacterium]|nr:aminoglycoside phosphotransferase family protein [Geodermatophilaceae bacterium]